MKTKALKLVQAALEIDSSFEYVKGMLSLAMSLELITYEEMEALLRENFAH